MFGRIAVNWKNVDCLVTGGAGFIGSHLVDKLLEKGAKVRVLDDLSRGNISNIEHCIEKVDFRKGDLKDFSVALDSAKDMDFCFHVAAVVGGVGFMIEHPGKMCENISINYNCIEACRQSNVERMLYVSSACVYPVSLQKYSSNAPLKEEDALNYGAAPDSYYGWSKLMGEIQCQAYHEEYGMKISVVRPFNPYGPRESFDPRDSHVIPALIRKAISKNDPFMVWGSGRQERCFTYISDLVEGIMLAIEKSSDADPINLGTDETVTIKKLTELILKVTKHNVPILYDTSKPEGVASRKADVNRVKKILAWEQKINLEAGIKKTINWYLEHKENES